jgi:hypothetical protein
MTAKPPKGKPDAPHIFENQYLFRPMSCAACHSCYEVRNADTGQWTGRCIYGGPFTGYRQEPPAQ